jgi:hypothetical protein
MLIHVGATLNLVGATLNHLAGTLVGVSATQPAEVLVQARVSGRLRRRW